MTAPTAPPPSSTLNHVVNYLDLMEWAAPELGIESETKHSEYPGGSYDYVVEADQKLMEQLFPDGFSNDTYHGYWAEQDEYENADPLRNAFNALLRKTYDLDEESPYIVFDVSW